MKFPSGTNETPTGDMYIVTNFNKLNTAFHVNGVLGIHRVSWSDIVKPDSTVNTGGGHGNRNCQNRWKTYNHS